MDNCINDKEFGPIEVVRSERSSRIRITIKPDSLRLTLPTHASLKDGFSFLEEIRPKLKAKQQKLKQQKPSSFINEENPLKTLSFVTNVKASSRDKVFFRLKDGILLIEYPETADAKSEKMQNAFKNGIDFFLRKEAKRLLVPRITQLAKKHNFFFKDVKIQSSKGRWGSCSSKKSINLSYYLLTLPAHLIDYVILHELCHTIEMNHGERFWALMDKVTDNKAKALRKEIKAHTTHL
jgi:predicted metal-dependent hydrolase